MKKTAQEPKVTENPLYHDTWMLLRKYRDVVWSLELSVQQVRRQFQIEYGSSIEEFLESLYVAGITFEGSAIEDHGLYHAGRVQPFQLRHHCMAQDGEPPGRPLPPSGIYQACSTDGQPQCCYGRCRPVSV